MHGQVVALPHGVIVEVVGGGDLHAPRAELGVDVVVGDDRDTAAHQGQFDEGADELGVALVVRVHGDSGVAEHRLRPSRGNDEVIVAGTCAAAVGEGIAQFPKAPFLFDVLHLEIRQCGLEHRVPIHQALAAVDEAVLVQAHEDFGHGAREAIVHGETLTGPVDGRAHAAQLLGDLSARRLFPCPHALDELLAAEFGPALLLLFELALDHHLRRDACVVRTHLPERVASAHALIANQRIHERVLERMAHVQAAGDIRRWDHDAE